jgi:hypothetical protein
MVCIFTVIYAAHGGYCADTVYRIIYGLLHAFAEKVLLADRAHLQQPG